METDEGLRTQHSDCDSIVSWRTSAAAFLALCASLLIACSDPSGSGGPATTGTRHGKPITVLIAASTSDVMREVAEQFKAKTGVEVKLSPGPSNGLATQIISGAPADLFLSANQKWADAVKEKGLVVAMKPLLTNDLVLIAPKRNPAGIKEPRDLTQPAVKKVALAGENVPAGAYAQQALAAMKLYDALLNEGKIVRGQDVRVTLSYVEQGEVEAGIVYSTDAALTTKVQVVHTFDSATFERIVYPLVLLKHGEANPAAKQFYDFLLSEEAAGTFARAGFKRLPVQP